MVWPFEWQEWVGRSRLWRLALMTLGVALVLACGYWLRLKGLHDAYRHGLAEALEQQRLLSQRGQQVTALDAAEVALAAGNAQLQDARWRLSGGAQMSDLLDRLAVSGRTHGLFFEQLDVDEPVQGPGYLQIPLQVLARGRYAALRSWLDDWLGQLRLLRVTHLQWEAVADRPGLLQLRLHLQVFHAGQALPVPASLAQEPARPPGEPPLFDPFAPWSSRQQAQGLAGVPLEQLEMVGSLSRAGRHQALLRWAGRVYRVAQGERLGREEGEIMRIDPDQVEVRERLFSAGMWHERYSYLALDGRAAARSRDEREKSVGDDRGGVGVDAGAVDAVQR